MSKVEARLDAFTIKVIERLCLSHPGMRSAMTSIDPGLARDLSWWDESGRLEVVLDKPNPEPEENKDVHTEHCCYNCGCKYGNEACPVETRVKRQSFRCDVRCRRY